MIRAATKRCTKCKEIKNTDEFYWSDGRHSKRMSRCKPCICKIRSKAEVYISLRERIANAKTNRKPCRSCGLATTSSIALCVRCQRDLTNMACGGTEWRDALQTAMLDAKGRASSATTRLNAWERKLQAICSSCRNRTMPSTSNAVVKPIMTWDKRLRTIAKKPYASNWGRKINNMVKNWNRKAARKTHGGKNKFKAIIQTSGTTEIQMRFDWS